MNSPKKLFLLDAYALIYRAYFAFIKNPRINSKGFNTSAVFGFANTLFELIKKESPSHLGVVFDTKDPTQRHIEYPKYKANREAMPEGIEEALPYIDRFLEAMNIPKLYKSGYEADDVIGTLAKKAEKLGFEIYIMTSDKDFAQLVSKNIFIYRPGNKWNPTEIWKEKEVLERFKISRVEQVIDFLGMMGDTVDNIPGIPGIGKKTAQKFLAEFDSMEGLFANIEKLKGKMRENVEEGRDLGILCKKLATIITDVPIEFSPNKFILKPKNTQQITTLFEELEFRNLLNKISNKEFQYQPSNSDSLINKTQNTKNEMQMNLFGNQNDIETATSLVEENKKYRLISSEDEIKDLVKQIIQEEIIAVYLCVTSDLDFHNQEILGVALSTKKESGNYIDFSDSNKDNIRLLKPIFQREDIILVGYNIKYYIKVLNKYNINFSAGLFDISIAHYLLYPEMRHNLDIIIENMLNITPNHLQGKGKIKKRLEDVELIEIKNYASSRANYIFQLYSILNIQLDETNIKELFNRIEMPLTSVLAFMEMEGIKLDDKRLDSYSKELQLLIEKQSNHIYSLAKMEFNIDSPKQLGDILFEKMKIAKKIKKTKSGQHSTSEETLLKLKDSNPIIEFILEYREIKKLLSTYVTVLPNLMYNNKLHTTFNQIAVSTGRLSSINPNLQNIPIKTKRGREIRKSFIARDKNFSLLSADYSQIELRIIAALSKDEGMLKAFKNREDIHVATAAKVYKVPLEEVNDVMRSRAKSVNFGIIYGISAFGLAQNIGSSRKEAKEIIDGYFLEFPKVKEYMDFAILEAREKEYAETVFGRRRYLRDINSRNAVSRGVAERNAINTPIQGSAADIIKQAMIKIHNTIFKMDLRSRMILQVHDELIFDMHNEEKEILKGIVQKNMESVIDWDVPLIVEMGIGKNWLDAH